MLAEYREQSTESGVQRAEYRRRAHPSSVMAMGDGALLL